MVKLKRIIFCEKAKDTSNKDSNTKSVSEILGNIKSIMKEECDSLGTLLSESVQNKITVSSNVPLSSLYTTVSDAALIEDFISQSKDSSPMSPAYVLSHLQDSDISSKGLILSYNGKNIINPRAFLLLNKQFKKINKESPNRANIFFNNKNHTDTYSMYTETVSSDYPMTIELEYSSGDREQFDISSDFSSLIDYLSKSKKDTIKIQQNIKSAEDFLSQFRDIKTPSVDKKRNELEDLKQILEKSKFDTIVLNAIQKVASTIASTPKVPNGKFSGDLGKYRNEETICLAIDKDNLDKKDRLQSHIVVSIYLNKKNKNSYTLTCYANPLSDTENLHVDSNDHLVL